MSENYIIHEGVTYYLAENLPPLKDHVETCPKCGGGGEMYGRNCKRCKGRGLVISTVFVDKPPSSESRSTPGESEQQ